MGQFKIGSDRRPATPGTDPAARAKPLSSSNQLSALDSGIADSLKVILNTLTSLGTTLQGMSGSGPRLTRPSLAPDQAMIILSDLMSQTSEARTKVEETSLKQANLQMTDANKRRDENLETARRKQEEAKEKAGSETLTRWLKTVGMLIGAVFSLVATAGAAAPVAVAAVIGAVLAVADLANSIAQEAHAMVTGADGKQRPLEISLGGMVRAIVEDGNCCPFTDEKRKEEWILGWTLTANILVAATALAAGGAGLRNLTQSAAESAEAVNQLAQAAKAVASVVSSGSELFQAGVSVAEGARGIEIGHLTYDMQTARAESDFYETMAKNILSKLQELMEGVKLNQSVLNDAWSMTSQVIAETSQAQSRIAHSI